MGQEKKQQMIIKDFVMINFILQIDSMYGTNLTEEVFEIQEEYNDVGGLQMPKDNNSWHKVMFRIYRQKNNVKQLISNLVDFAINCLYMTIIEFTVIIYNYFGAIVVIVVQMIGLLSMDPETYDEPVTV
jgi:hypothetical protein